MSKQKLNHEHKTEIHTLVLIQQPLPLNQRGLAFSTVISPNPVFNVYHALHTT